MADADGATQFPDIEKLEKGLNDLQPWPVSIRYRLNDLQSRKQVVLT